MALTRGLEYIVLRVEGRKVRVVSSNSLTRAENGGRARSGGDSIHGAFDVSATYDKDFFFAASFAYSI